jgi:dUTP pyrophosphatase
VDAGYRGEIRVTLLNTDGHHAVSFQRGDRIAQLVIQQVACAVLQEVESLPGSARAAGGFGSTGGHGAGPPPAGERDPEPARQEDRPGNRQARSE